MKRFFAWVLVLALLAGVLPAQYAGAEEITPLESESFTYINPRYADVVDASQLDQPGVMPLEEVEYHESVEEAGLALREAMKARQTTIQIGVKLTEVPDTIFNDMVAIAEAHTGDPVEGDYICWQYLGMDGSASGYSMGAYQYVTLTMTVTYYTTAAEEAKVDAAVEKLLAELDVWDADDYTKVKAVYDWLCNNITYDYAHVNNNSYYHMRTAYGGIIDRTCVCQGYAVLLYRLLLELGVDNRFIGGASEGEGHAWNIVKLGGVYYNLDSTWDAPLAVEGYEYEYFLRTDGNFKDHDRDPEFATAAFYEAYPMATADYEAGGTILPDDDLEQDDVVAQGTWGADVSWSLAEDGTLTISGSGQMESDDRLTNRGTPWDDYKEQITYVVIADGITNIASDAFSECVNLTGADIPESVTSIDMGAFYGCTALESIDIPAGVTAIGFDAYYGCNSVTEIMIPETVTTIEDYAFSYCEGLEAITIPGSVQTVPYGLFYGCHKLATVELSEGIEELAGSVFADCSALESITIPASVGTIGDYCFSGSGLTEITFLGDAPAFGGESVFADTSVTARYPAANSTWTDAVKQSYGGAVTWTAEGHTHSYDDVWEYDEYQHWQVCTGCGEETEHEDHYAYWAACGQETVCDGCSIAIVFDGPHEDADGDEFCDICGYSLDVEAGGVFCDFYWVYGDGLLAVGGSDEMPDLDSAEDYPWYRYAEDVTTVGVIGLGVGDHAFQGYPNLQMVMICANEDTGVAVSSIGAEAFADNENLVEIIFADEAPEIAEDAFANVTAEVEYDGSWDADLLQNYGGNLTWTVAGEEPHEHSYTAEVTDPTCTEEGYTTYTCECGDSYQDDFVDALGHSFDSWETDEYQHWQVCDCGETTEKENHDAALMACGQVTFCEGCGVEIIWNRSHADDDGDGYCDTCGWMPDVVAGGRGEDWLWCITDGWLMISGEGEMIEASSEAEYPWYFYYDQIEVVAVLGVDIGDYAFRGYPNLTTVLLGSNDDTGSAISSIGTEAFADNEKLEQVEFWNEAPEIAEDAFRGVTATVEYDGTWDESLLQNYGGDLTWTVAGEDEEHEHSYTRSTVQPTCTEQGYTRYLCSCGDSYQDNFVDALGHSYEDGVCTVCGAADPDWEEVHEHSYVPSVTEPTCTTKGYTIYTCDCGDSYEDDYVDALGHSFEEGECTVCGEDDPDWNEPHEHSYVSKVTEPTCTEKGYTTYTCDCGDSYEDDYVDALGHSYEEGECTVCGAADPDWEKPVDPEPEEGELTRLAGANRFDTAFRVADAMKEELGVEKFDAIIVASGTSFADALSGSYLSAVKNAPILLSYNDTYNTMAKNYIIANLKHGGTVYILGGYNAVPVSMESGLSGFTVKRLAGEDRFGTNLAILREAGVADKEILVCTGLSFADSLSASASELPILLVWNNLTEAQKGFLDGLDGNKLCVIGGTTAVSKSMEKQVSAYGETRRIGGANRFETSVLIAEAFFDAPENAVLAYAWNFPDGLCGGGLAAVLDAPLVLTMDKYEAKAAEYVQGQGIGNGYILGSGELISDKTVKTIFDMTGEITLK